MMLGIWFSIVVITLADTWQSWRTLRNELVEHKIQTILLTQSQIVLSNEIEQRTYSDVQAQIRRSNDGLAATIGDPPPNH